MADFTSPQAMKDSPDRTQNLSELEAFSAKVQLLKKKAMTPRKKIPVVQEHQKKVPKYKEPMIAAKTKIVDIAPSLFPLESAIEDIREALQHERNGCNEVALRIYYKVAEQLTSAHPSYQKIQKRIDDLENGVHGSRRNQTIPATPAQFLKSALKSQPVPFFPPSTQNVKLSPPLKNPQFDKYADNQEEEQSAKDSEEENDEYISPPLSPHNKVVRETVEIQTQTENETVELTSENVVEVDIAESTALHFQKLDKDAVNQEVRNLLEQQVVDILNNGSAEDLVKLPGIGPKRAQYVIEYREEDGGGFDGIHDLQEIGMSESQVEKLKKNLLTFQLMGVAK